MRKLFFTANPSLFILLTIGAVITTFGYKLRAEGIFSCQAHGYSSVAYLAYCHATAYGDYDHGAFWFDLEPGAAESAKNAEVLFLGNSRMQVGFSTPATSEWFSSTAAHYFLLGFYLENYLFEQELLNKLIPQARVYVINLDSFFERWESPFGRAVMVGAEAHGRYERKRLWQAVHEPVCNTLPAICGNQYVVFRSRATGFWKVSGGALRIAGITVDTTVDHTALKQDVLSGREFLSRLPARSECVIPTIVPTFETKTETARAIAAALGLDLMAPEVDGLLTFDGSHLDPPSAERWSKAFFEAAGPQIRKCLDSPLQSSR